MQHCGYFISKKLIILLVIVTNIFYFYNKSTAQSCNGTLGAAIVNETFGKGTISPLLTGQTTYTYTAGCPLDGVYTINNYTDCFAGNWHHLAEDHTPGDLKGNMMIVNAAAAAGEFYKQTVTSLCYGTTYEFSVWVLNLNNTSPSNGCNKIAPIPLDPNITMSVELLNGQVLQMINTGAVLRTDGPTWIRYAMLFTTPVDDKSIIIKLINNGPGGCGNDLALDDIEISPCQQPLEAGFRDTVATQLTVCENGGSTTLAVRAPNTNYLNPVYQWQESRDSVSWTPIADANQLTYEAQPNFTGKKYYRVLCTSAANVTENLVNTCSTFSPALTLTTTDDCHPPKLYIPDIFTPNGDGINDQLQVFYDGSSASSLDAFAIKVYDRWGSIIFSSDKLSVNWDGTYQTQPCLPGMYSWSINYKINYKNQLSSFTKRGQILLTR